MHLIKKNVIITVICFAIFGCSQKTTDPKLILKTYADIAAAKYEDSLITAQSLHKAIDNLILAPSEETLAIARASWLAARIPYQQTEVYRFGNPIVDAWEGRVNAWPLDEGLIDYVDNSYGTQSEQNALYTLNVISNPYLKVNGRDVDATEITPTLISEVLHEAESIETNVASGYHAIEFLLWGQDLNGNGPGAGSRPATDFDIENCPTKNCDRRADYLIAAATLLIKDLEEIVAKWQSEGEARSYIMKTSDNGLAAVLTGMGSLSYGELAGERMKLGLLLRDPEEEHDCFSDNTHNSHFYDQVGIESAFHGRYERINGEIVSGPSIAELINEKNPDLHIELVDKLQNTHAALDAIRLRAESGEAYDQMIGEDNPEGNIVVQTAIDSLNAQARTIERAFATLGLSQIEFEGSDSLDNPDAVFQ